MKKLIILIGILLPIILIGCSSDVDGYPYIQYLHSTWTFDENNKCIDVPDGYILNEGYSYDIIETENGYDIILHFIKD